MSVSTLKPSAVKLERFADEHQREKLDQIGDPLTNIDALLNFKALSARVDKISPKKRTFGTCEAKS
ncbi:hypothetical protein [Orrella sp. 11846]|uniref:hypothetical protein n=1 Tax=Orrella sp. 11846 TaxID=3409913 RepID=UPI003B5CE9D4